MDGVLWTTCWRYDDGIVEKAGGGSVGKSPASDAGRRLGGDGDGCVDVVGAHGEGGGGGRRTRKRPSYLTKDSSWTLDPLEEWTGMSRIESQRKLSLSENDDVVLAVTPASSSTISPVDATARDNQSSRRAMSHP